MMKHTLVFASLVSMLVATARSAELILKAIDPISALVQPQPKANQVPHSRVAVGANNISEAWFSDATQRYAHGILGDSIEASTLSVRTREDALLQFTVPNSTVFEDLEPRIHDLDGDQRDDIITIESDLELGASLAVFTVEENRLIRVASTPFIGQANRWLNPVGVGDFDGDDNQDIALIVTPHIGGVLHLYRYAQNELSRYAEFSGVSNHRIGSTELGLGVVVDFPDQNGLILPEQSHNSLVLLAWTATGIKVVSRVELPSRLNSSMRQTGFNQWVFTLLNGASYQLNLAL
jgi:hypothetical protein